MSERQRLAVEALRKEVPDVQVDFEPLTGAAKYVVSTSRFLTQSQPARLQRPLSYDEAMAKVKAFVGTHRELFPHGPEALDAGVVTRKDMTEASGLQTLAWSQRAVGLPVFGTLFKANLSKTGEIMSLSSEFLEDVEAAAASYLTAHPDAVTFSAVSVEKAVSLAAATIGENFAPALVTKVTSPNPKLRAEFFEAPGLSTTWAEKVWLPMDATTARLAWAVTVESPADGMFTVLVDADNGEAVLRHSLTAADATPQYRVWTGDSPTPMSPGFADVTDATVQPPLAARQLVQLESINPSASPSGWISTGGTTTTGNNVDAYTDRDNSNTADPGSRPIGTGTDSRTFDFTIDLAQDPSTHTAGSVTQLFYRCNWIHDRLYSLGFTESAGNFQTNNFARNGNPATDSGDVDAVMAESHDSALSTATGGQQFNNANFSTPQDGFPPRMQMYLFNGPTPDRDASLDAEMIVHEYVHGLSSRLVGTGVGISQLQTSGMGEGWSDFYALSMLSATGDDPHANYPLFAYLGRQFSSLGEANFFWGLRRYPYSTNLKVNPLTFKDIDQNNLHPSTPINPALAFGVPANEVHAMGEVWSSMLWEARARMIDRNDHAAGNETMLQLVTDGMKLAPANPNFIQARNAILQADLNNNGGANLDMLWNAFAKRGLGFSATSPASTTTAGLVEAFDLPPSVDAIAPSITFAPLVNQQPIFEFSSSGSHRVGGAVNESSAVVTFKIEEFTPSGTPNRFWNGSNWVTDPAAPGLWLPATVSGGNWSPAPGLALPLHANTRNGLYLIYARAVDVGGNVGEGSVVVLRSVNAETVLPVASIGYPGNSSSIAGLNLISGTASDPAGGSGLTGAVTLRIVGPQGEYWTGNAWSATLATVSANVNASGIWEYRSLPAGSNFRSGSYQVTATASDWAGNNSVQNSGNNISFTVDPALDTTLPTIQITSPGHNSIRNGITQIAGTAADVGSGLALAVTVTINHGTDYWNGSAWTSTQTAVIAPVASNGSWAFTSMPTGSNVRAGIYAVSAKSYDFAGNLSASVSGVNNILVTVDVDPPSLTITAPKNGVQFPAFPMIAGTADDSKGIQYVAVFLRRNSDWRYWNGTVWVSDAGQASLTSTYNAGNETFTGNFTLPVLGVNAESGAYNYTAIAADGAGNTRQRDAAINVITDTTLPTVTIGSPTNGTVIGSGPITIQGTAGDISGIAGVSCFVRRNSDNLYWNGSGWGGTTLHLPTNYYPDTGLWVCTGPVPQPGAALADGSYNFIAIATDAAGNYQQTDSAVTVTYTAPTPAEVLPISADPGPTPGDLFQGALVDAAPSTPPQVGFDLRDAFGGEFSTFEVGRAVLSDGLGSAVQNIYFHTAAPVTLSGFKLYLGDDGVVRGASHVELAVTDPTFSSSTILSTVDLPSPYPSAVGANNIRHILVSDGFAPVTGQYFVLRLTPANPNIGVRVIEFDGVAATGILAATHVDFSTAGYVAAITAPPPAIPATQTPVNGFTYGYYEGTNSKVGAFSITGMSGSGSGWNGNQGLGTPGQGFSSIHPGSGSTRSAVVRRYTVGAGGEAAYSGEVRIVGRFSDIDTGAVDAFIMLDPDGDAGGGARSFLLPPTGVNGATATIAFDLPATVGPNATIDFGALAGASGDFDAIGFHAWIVTGDTAVPTQIVANNYTSVISMVTSSTDLRSVAAAMATDGVVSAADEATFDTTPGTAAHPYQFAGLLYLENAGSGKATRFDSVRIDVTTGGDFSDTPRLYVLRHNSDPVSSNPAADDRYARLPVVPVRIAANSAGQPAYTFDLKSLSPAERTGYGYAVVGAGMYQGTSISISELSASAVRVADTAVITPQPFLVPGPNGHRYGLSVVRGDWEQSEASAVTAGGHLVTINDAVENAFLVPHFGGTERFYIGLKQDGPGATTEPGDGWRWRTGELLSAPGAYLNWHSTQPNGSEGPEEDFGFMNEWQPPGTWGDAVVGGYPPALRNTFRGIIELDTAGTGQRPSSSLRSAPSRTFSTLALQRPLREAACRRPLISLASQGKT